MNSYDDDDRSDPLDDCNVSLHGSMLLSSTDQWVQDYTYIYDPLVVSPSSLSSASPSSATGSYPFMNTPLPTQQQALPSPLSSVPSWPNYYSPVDMYPSSNNANGEYWPRFSDVIDYEAYTLSSSPEDLTTSSNEERVPSCMFTTPSRSAFNLMLPPGVSSQYHHATTTNTTAATSASNARTSATITSSFGGRKKRGMKRTKEKKKCMNCGATKTPTWRRGPITRWLLCNACGL